MKKTLILYLTVFLLAGCTKSVSQTASSNTSVNSGGCAAFAECETTEDEAKLYESLIAANDSPFKQATLEEVVSYFDNNEDRIIYLGFRDCPWCQDLLPILNDIATEKKLMITYVNVRPENTKESDLRSGDNLTYIRLQEILGDVSGDQTGKIYVPYIAVIRQGKVVDYMLSFDYDAHETQISQEDIEKYKLRLTELLSK